MPEQNGIYYKVEGNGFPVVLLHGFCETHEIWKDFAPPLASQFTVISIDLPGFGKSALLPSFFTLTDVAKSINKLLEALHINSCVLIGHSLGGYVSLAMVENQPERFKGFGLFHSTAYADTDEKKISRNKVIEFVEANGVEPFIKSFVPPLFYNQQNPSIPWAVSIGLQTKPETLIAYTAAMRDRPDRTSVLKTFKRPILFIAGEKDTVVSEAAIKSQAEIASTPYVFVIRAVGHMGMVEHGQATLQSVITFVEALNL
jgi:pimeloyl-ACP methyl ester carboxylesterase